jgi:hypothetical protein
MHARRPRPQSWLWSTGNTALSLLASGTAAARRRRDRVRGRDGAVGCVRRVHFLPDQRGRYAPQLHHQRHPAGHVHRQRRRGAAAPDRHECVAARRRQRPSDCRVLTARAARENAALANIGVLHPLSKATAQMAGEEGQTALRLVKLAHQRVRSTLEEVRVRRERAVPHAAGLRPAVARRSTATSTDSTSRRVSTACGLYSAWRGGTRPDAHARIIAALADAAPSAGLPTLWTSLPLRPCRWSA